MKKFYKALAVTGAASLLGVSSASAACVNEDTFCYDASVYGGFLQTSPEDSKQGTSLMSVYGRSDVKIEGKTEKDGWEAKGTVKLELNTGANGANNVDEVYVTLSSGKVSIVSGLTDFGDISSTGGYTTEQGSSTDGDYGNDAGDAPTLGVKFAAAEGVDVGLALIPDVTTHNFDSDNDGTNDSSVPVQKQTINLFATYASDVVEVGFAYESASESENDAAKDAGYTAPDGTAAMGLSAVVPMGQFSPFFNYGSADDGTNTASSINLGVDLNDIAGLGMTVGLENNDDGQGNDDSTYSNTYVAVSKPLGPTSVTFQFWNTSKETGGDTQTEINIEFAMKL